MEGQGIRISGGISFRLGDAGPWGRNVCVSDEILFIT